MNDALEPFLTSSELAKILRVSRDKVMGWIRRGQLTAINVSEGARPRYRVSRESLEEFLKVREVQPPPSRTKRRQSQRPPEGGPIDPVLGEKLLKKGQAKKCGGKYYRVWNGITLYV